MLATNLLRVQPPSLLSAGVEEHRADSSLLLENEKLQPYLMAI